MNAKDIYKYIAGLGMVDMIDRLAEISKSSFEIGCSNEVCKKCTCEIQVRSLEAKVRIFIGATNSLHKAAAGVWLLRSAGIDGERNHQIEW